MQTESRQFQSRKRKLVIPIFIPHLGCPHACVFCNQHSISGVKRQRPPDEEEVRASISLWLERSAKKRDPASVEVAFYGGSFTGLPVSLQRQLLGAVQPSLKQGQVGSIRLSTRPDYIDAESIRLLQDYGVSLVELGVQSLDNAVLTLSQRGHSFAQVVEAVARLREAHMQVGIQLMPGLPGESLFSLRRTVRKAVTLAPDCVRLYPVLVVDGSELADWYRAGRFQPHSLEKAVVLTAWMSKYFSQHGIRVIRMGLQASESLDQACLAGPYHPAFGEMVASRRMFQKTKRLLRRVQSKHPRADNAPFDLHIAHRDLSVFYGIKKANVQRLRDLNLPQFRLYTHAEQARHTVCLVSDEQGILQKS